MNNKEDYLIHYKKINIMGDEGVGKTSLITLFENYHNKNFIINPPNNNLSMSNSQLGLISTININSLVENIKKITVEYNENTNLYLNIYETDLIEIENIKNHLDTLLLQTECIIFIFDNNNINSFQNIQKLIPIINQKIENFEIRNIPLFILKNKIDLPDTDQEQTEKINENLKNLLDKYQNLIIFQEISLCIREKFNDFIKKFYDNCYSHSKIDPKDLVNSIKLNDPLRVVRNTLNLNNFEKQIKILFIGSCSVGKTSFINCYFGKMNEPLATTGIDMETIYGEINGKTYSICFYDTAGQERFAIMTKTFYRRCKGIFLFFDLSNKYSFDDITNRWLKEIKGNAKTGTLINLIGNKLDLIDKREISKDEAKCLAKDNGLFYYECSCINKIGVYEIVNEMIYRLLKNNMLNVNDSIEEVKLKPKQKNKKQEKQGGGCC